MEEALPEETWSTVPMLWGGRGSRQDVSVLGSEMSLTCSWDPCTVLLQAVWWAGPGSRRATFPDSTLQGRGVAAAEARGFLASLGREITFGSGFGLLPRCWKFCTWSLVTRMATATPPHLQRLPGVSGTPSWPRVWVFVSRSLPRAALGWIRHPSPSAVPFCTSGWGSPARSRSKEGISQLVLYTDRAKSTEQGECSYRECASHYGG